MPPVPPTPFLPTRFGNFHEGEDESLLLAAEPIFDTSIDESEWGVPVGPSSFTNTPNLFSDAEALGSSTIRRPSRRDISASSPEVDETDNEEGEQETPRAKVTLGKVEKTLNLDDYFGNEENSLIEQSVYQHGDASTTPTVVRSDPAAERNTEKQGLAVESGMKRDGSSGMLARELSALSKKPKSRSPDRDDYFSRRLSSSLSRSPSIPFLPPLPKTSPSITSRLTPAPSPPPIGYSTLRPLHEPTSSRRVSRTPDPPSSLRPASHVMVPGSMPPPLPRSQSLSPNQSSSESAEKPLVPPSRFSASADADPEIRIRPSQEKPARQSKSSTVAEQPIHANAVAGPSRIPRSTILPPRQSALSRYLAKSTVLHPAMSAPKSKENVIVDPATVDRVALVEQKVPVDREVHDELRASQQRTGPLQLHHRDTGESGHGLADTHLPDAPQLESQDEEAENMPSPQLPLESIPVLTAESSVDVDTRSRSGSSFRLLSPSPQLEETPQTPKLSAMTTMGVMDKRSRRESASEKVLGFFADLLRSSQKASIRSDDGEAIRAGEEIRQSAGDGVTFTTPRVSATGQEDRSVNEELRQSPGEAAAPNLANDYSDTFQDQSVPTSATSSTSSTASSSSRPSTRPFSTSAAHKNPPGFIPITRPSTRVFGTATASRALQPARTMSTVPSNKIEASSRPITGLKAATYKTETHSSQSNFHRRTQAQPYSLSRPRGKVPTVHHTTAFTSAALAKLPPPGKGSSSAAAKVQVKPLERARDLNIRRAVFDRPSSAIVNTLGTGVGVGKGAQVPGQGQGQSASINMSMMKTIPLTGHTPGKASRQRMEQRAIFDRATREKLEEKERLRLVEERKKQEEEERRYREMRKETVVWAKPVPEGLYATTTKEGRSGE